MSENPDKWAVFWKNLQLVIGAFLAVTAAAYVETLGLMGLALVWLGLFAVVSTVYAVRFRNEAKERRRTVSRPTGSSGEDSSQVRRLETDLRKTREVVERLMVEKSELIEQQSELREQPRSVESQEARVGLRQKENAKLRERIEELEKLQSSPPAPAIPQPILEHVATVTLDTQLNPFDSYNEPFDKGEVIEVEAKSKEGETFHFFVCNENDFEVNRYRTVNFEYYEGKKYTARFKKQIEIPSSDTWFFIAYTPEGEEYTTVQLTISRVR